MSTPEQRELVEIGSKIKVVKNAKGDPQWEISVRENADPAELDRLRAMAISQYRALEREFAQ